MGVRVGSIGGAGYACGCKWDTENGWTHCPKHRRYFAFAARVILGIAGFAVIAMDAVLLYNKYFVG